MRRCARKFFGAAACSRRATPGRQHISADGGAGILLACTCPAWTTRPIAVEEMVLNP